MVFGKFKKSGNKRIPQSPSQWIVGQGKHQPIWDEQTYCAILAEKDRREGLRSRSQTYALTGLLECSVCHTAIHRHGKLGAYVYVNCRAQNSHVNTRYETALKLVADKIISAIQEYKNSPIIVDSKDRFDEQICTQQTLRQRIQEGFEAGVYTAIEAQSKIVAAETEIERLTRARDHSTQQHQQRQILLQFAEQDLNRMHRWILNDDPATVNHFLTSLCEKITISPENELDVIWRL